MPTTDSLLDAIEALMGEHRRCWWIESDVADGLVWLECAWCGGEVGEAGLSLG